MVEELILVNVYMDKNKVRTTWRWEATDEVICAINGPADEPTRTFVQIKNISHLAGLSLS
jgi:hypothetical protein